MKNTGWNLGLLYKGENDPQIEKDVIAIESAYIKFEKRYRGKDFTSSPERLHSALKDYELLVEKITPKPWWYFALRTRLNSEDSKAEAASTRIEQRLHNASNRVQFFSLVLGKIPVALQKKYLQTPSLSKYRYQLQVIFDGAKYNLSESEEQLANLLSQTSYRMWVDGQDKVVTQLTVEHNGKEIPITEAIPLIANLPKKERNVFHKKVHELLKSNSKFAEAEINAIYNFKKIMDERRGYKKPYSSTALHYENDEKTIESLVSTVTKYFNLSNRFYTLHAKLLGEKKLTMADRAVKIGSIKKKFDFDSAIEIVRGAFGSVGSKYVDIFDSFLKNRQIDVYPKKGKDSGAFCWGMGKLPTFVLLNHIDDIRSVETLAHEMGHAIHTELSKKQPSIYEHYSTACAEVASTFFEQLITDELVKHLSEEEQIILLHNKILGDVATIFRQIACFNFELELHTAIRKNGQIDRQEIAKLLQKNMQAYVGKSVEVTPNDGFFFVYWSHIRRFFYVYSYAYGQIISRALYENWKKDASYEKKVEQFLSAGRSMSPKDIFKSIGIITNEKFFESGLKGIEEDINKLEKLAKKQKRI